MMQWLPWIVGLIALGIPHGAMDHEVGAAVSRSARSHRIRFITAYLMIVGLGLACWFLWPLGVLTAFLVVAAIHFGQGDVAWSRMVGSASLRDVRGYQGVLLLVRGCLPILLPVIAWPVEFSRAVSILGQDLMGGTSAWSTSETLRSFGTWLLASLIALQGAWGLVLGCREGGRLLKALTIELIESIVLVLTFVLVPPILAVGVYFNAWHAIRHVARLLPLLGESGNLENPEPADQPTLITALWRFHHRALPMTLAALGGMVMLGLVILTTGPTITQVGLIALATISALTFPHVLVVTWMDYCQGVWKSRPSALYEWEG